MAHINLKKNYSVLLCMTISGLVSCLEEALYALVANFRQCLANDNSF